jgi:hypothetical protein
MPDADTPRRTPRRETRQQWTLKHATLTPELRALVAKAAELQGMPAGQWVAHVLRDRAQAVVRGDGEPRAGVPAVPPQRIDAIEQQVAELAEAVRLLTDQRPRRSWWSWSRKT